jgi:hypothetical protein
MMAPEFRQFLKEFSLLLLLAGAAFVGGMLVSWFTR